MDYLEKATKIVELIKSLDDEGVNALVQFMKKEDSSVNTDDLKTRIEDIRMS